MSHDLGHGITAFGDLISFGVVVGTISQFLPSVAAITSVIWTLIRIYETQTVQRFLNRDRD